jgi:hypothetical protein
MPILTEVHNGENFRSRAEVATLTGDCVSRVRWRYGMVVPWRESNPHALRRTILSRVRLPIPPHGLAGQSI